MTAVVMNVYNVSSRCASCGRVSLSSQGVLDRFTQIKPKVIFSVEAVRYNNKTHDHLEKLKAMVAGLPEIRKVVLFPFCSSRDIDTSRIPNW